MLLYKRNKNHFPRLISAWIKDLNLFSPFMNMKDHDLDDVERMFGALSKIVIT